MAEVNVNLAASLADAIFSTSEFTEVASRGTRGLGLGLQASRCILLFRTDASLKSPMPATEWTKDEPRPDLDEASLLLAKAIQNTISSFSSPVTLNRSTIGEEFGAGIIHLNALDISEILATTIRPHGLPDASIILYRRENQPAWSAEEIGALVSASRMLERALEHCALISSESLANGSSQSFQNLREASKPAVVDPRDEEVLQIAPAASEEQRVATANRYRRLVEYSGALIFHVDLKHKIDFISRRSIEFFGVPPEDFLSGEGVCWHDLVHTEDRVRVVNLSNDPRALKSGFQVEFRILNHISGKARWVLGKFVPVIDAVGGHYGWDGFAVDISDRKYAQNELEVQSRKVRALYTVSSAIRGYLDPSNIASRGLAALCDATGAHAGLCYLYPDATSEKLNLISQHGFSDDFTKTIEESSSLPSLSKYVAQHGQTVLVPDIQNDPRASKIIAEKEGFRSAVLVPISVEEETLGTLGLFHKDASVFDGQDVMLVSAAANQIGLAARQAKLFAAYRKQTSNLSALYRLTRELSGYHSVEELFQKSFNVIRDELGMKRLWLGLLNETGTRVVGQAAFGPGWRRRLVEINVEIVGRDHPIAQVVTTRKPKLIEDPEAILSEFGVKRFFSRFSVGRVGLVPLISGGQVLGVLAFQPGDDQFAFEDDELTLLSSLASEIAASLLSKKLEERIGEGEKMRTAGLLAAGIAHNFNNLLQAILGQASLLEMLAFDNEQVKKASMIINDAANKGASLVKQLVSFANLEEPSTEVCDINSVLERNATSLKRDLGDQQVLKFSFGKNLPRASVDSRQLIRIIGALVTNAAEAMNEVGEVTIFSDGVNISKDNPHYEVPYGEYLRVGVRDNGIGMNAEERKRCFEPFFTTKDVDPSSGLGMSGAGLGLAAAYALARKNGGRLVVDSRKGHGSVFTLYIPVVHPEYTKSGLNEAVTISEVSERKRGQVNLTLIESDSSTDSDADQSDNTSKKTKTNRGRRGTSHGH